MVKEQSEEEEPPKSAFLSSVSQLGGREELNASSFKRTCTSQECFAASL